MYDITSSAPIKSGRTACFWENSSVLEKMSKIKGLTRLQTSVGENVEIETLCQRFR